MMPLLLLLGAIAALPAHGGTIRNTDNKEYVFVVHWEDLSTPEKYEISPGESRSFDDKRATIELLGKKDNIYVRPTDAVVIRNGVMQVLEKPDPKVH